MSPVEKEFVEIANLRLPPKDMRWGGPRFRDDTKYIQSGKSSVNYLTSLCGLSAQSRLLDVGMWPGEIAHRNFRRLRWHPQIRRLDVHKPSIEWSSKNLANGRVGHRLSSPPRFSMSVTIPKRSGRPRTSRFQFHPMISMSSASSQSFRT